jgi:hypothetical protein
VDRIPHDVQRGNESVVLLRGQQTGEPALDGSHYVRRIGGEPLSADVGEDRKTAAAIR